ncbi:MAG: putative holin-like toxin [Lactobacillales bacterium]|nr:putative holin-like toxin [Lactobacillales bacterium]
MKGDAFLEVQEAIQLMLGFGTFVVTLLTFVLALIKHNNNQKK